MRGATQARGGPLRHAAGYAAGGQRTRSRRGSAQQYGGCWKLTFDGWRQLVELSARAVCFEGAYSHQPVARVQYYACIKCVPQFPMEGVQRAADQKCTSRCTSRKPGAAGGDYKAADGLMGLDLCRVMGACTIHKGFELVCHWQPAVVFIRFRASLIPSAL